MFFRFFVSTGRLLPHIKLRALGVTDANRKFHFSGLGISNHEVADDYALCFNALKSDVHMVTGERLQPKVLVCDADAARHNRFEIAFGITDNEPVVEDEADVHRYLIIMCYCHVTFNIQSKYKFVDKKNKVPFKGDVKIVHLCDNEQKFDAACALFVRKWRPV